MRISVRIAALYDIHGNLPALEAVLGDVRAAEVDQVVVGGDVLPGPMPGACMAALRALEIPVEFLYGNGERDVLTIRGGTMPARVPAAFQETMRWVVDAVDGADLDFMATWPATVRRRLPALGDVLFCHATPNDENTIFTRVTDEGRLATELRGVDADLIVCGHTHMQFDRIISIDGRPVRLVNAGSVGMPFGAPGAYWALLHEDVMLQCTRYDLDAAQDAVAATDYPLPSDLRSPPAEADMLETFEAASLRKP